MNDTFVDLHEAATKAAEKVAQAYVDKHYDGKDSYPCGFAWVVVYPKHKGNTKLGKDERHKLEAIGFTKDYANPKAYTLWNPSKWPGQNVDTKYAGAVAYAEAMNAMTDLTFYAQERLD